LPFKSILCGVEGNESSTEAARQAIALAAAGGADLHFIAARARFEVDADSSEESLEKSLEEATALAGESGVEASMEMAKGEHSIDILLAAAKGHDLLVLGTHDHSRAAGIVLGSTASEAAHRAERPLLIARRADGDGFPGRILLASDGSPASWPPVRAAAAVATATGADLELVHVADGKHPDAAGEVEAQAAEIQEIMGTAPRVSQPLGSARSEIVEAASSGGASMIVCGRSGRRGRRGLKALGSVSERIVHDAGCSVMLVPSEDGATGG
jgi:nucleotide-binding universal stress UspA family protein